jgi:drug/metabolite transporter (DMT)-like permease
LAALASALIWAVAAQVYRGLGRRISPLLLNFSKGAVALGAGALVLVIGRPPAPETPPVPLLWLALSGVVGIGLGDSFYLGALKQIGARRALILESLAPPLAAVLAWLCFGETLEIGGWAGVGLTVLGGVWVVMERTPEAPLQSYRGLLWGTLGALGQAAGAVMARYAFLCADIAPFWALLIRLGAGQAMIILLLSQAPPAVRSWPPFQWHWVSLLAITAFASTFLAILGQQTALKYAPAGVAQALLATSPLFILPIAAWSGEKISLRALGGVVLALAGIALLLSYR